MSSPVSPPPVSVTKLHKWHRVVLGICFIAFAAELGCCLLILPWLSNWDLSYIPVHSPTLSDLWMSPYFRGVLSGLGLLNIYVAVAELARLVRAWLHYGRSSK